MGINLDTVAPDVLNLLLQELSLLLTRARGLVLTVVHWRLALAFLVQVLLLTRGLVITTVHRRLA